MLTNVDYDDDDDDVDDDDDDDRKLITNVYKEDDFYLTLNLTCEIS